VEGIFYCAPCEEASRGTAVQGVPGALEPTTTCPRLLPCIGDLVTRAEQGAGTGDCSVQDADGMVE
jgi:hypothetical protein